MRTTIGPALWRLRYQRAVREALRLQAPTFAFITQPGDRPGDVQRGRDEWASRGGLPPLAVIMLPAGEASANAIAKAVAPGLQLAVTAGAGAVMLLHGADAVGAWLPAQRETAAAVARLGFHVPVLHVLTADDVMAPDIVAALTDDGLGWCLAPGMLHGVRDLRWPHVVAATGQLATAGLPGAVWVREPRTTGDMTEHVPVGLGAMGLGVWWDLLQHAHLSDVSVYVDMADSAIAAAAELHSVRRLMQVAQSYGTLASVTFSSSIEVQR